MGVGPGEIGAYITKWSGPIFDTIGWVIQIVLVIAVLYWFYIIYTFDTKILISEIGKNKKVINSEVRAKEIKNKKTGIPRLKTMGFLGFGGEIIEKPPAECIIPFKSRITNRFYQFVKRDGLYWPVQNMVLGRLIEGEDGEEIYSVEGSGLELNRDYNAEDAILNRLENAAIKYRNKDERNKMYLSFGIIFLCVIVSGVIMVLTINKIGGLEQAIASLREPIKEGIQNAMANKIGPG